MPFDQKRINGPDSSFSYRQFIEHEDIVKQKQKSKKRVDGRNFNEHRKFGECLKQFYGVSLTNQFRF